QQQRRGRLRFWALPDTTTAPTALRTTALASGVVPSCPAAYPSHPALSTKTAVSPFASALTSVRLQPTNSAAMSIRATQLSCEASLASVSTQQRQELSPRYVLALFTFLTPCSSCVDAVLSVGALPDLGIDANVIHGPKFSNMGYFGGQVGSGGVAYHDIERPGSSASC
ncbi:hypothetical protein F442_13474, partial [Phytophthora nicotianae P10297]